MNESSSTVARLRVRSAATRRTIITLNDRPRTQSGKSFTNVPAGVASENFAFLSTPVYLKKLLTDTSGASSRRSFVVRKYNNRDVEDYAEENAFLKRKLAQLKLENQNNANRCRRLKESLVKNEREAFQFKDALQTSDLSRNNSASHLENLRNFKLLHQRIYRLEQCLQEKEDKYNRLVTSMKFTRVEELEAQLETVILEAQNLQKENMELSAKLQNSGFKIKTRTKKGEETQKYSELRNRITAMGKVIKNLNDEKQELVAKNKHLIARMRQLLRNDNFTNDDIEQELRHLCQMGKPPTPNSPGDPDLKAKIIETINKKDREAKKSKYLFAKRMADGDYRNEGNLCNEVSVNPVEVNIKETEVVHTPDFFPSPLHSPATSKTSEEKDGFEKLDKEQSAILIQRYWRSYRKRQIPVIPSTSNITASLEALNLDDGRDKKNTNESILIEEEFSEDTFETDEDDI